jgi:dTDP-4-amino-4,6-dideoxygalactose transaminase
MSNTGQAANAGNSRKRILSHFFAEVNDNSQNITSESIRAVLTPRTKSVICAHLVGWPCNMDRIMYMAVEKGLNFIEDCDKSHGANYKGMPYICYHSFVQNL